MDFCTVCNQTTDHLAEEHQYCSNCQREVTVRHVHCYKCNGCVAPRLKERMGYEIYNSVSCLNCKFTWSDFDSLLYKYEEAN